MKIALFVTCIGDTLFPAARARRQVLERLGHEVVFPEEQTCCGQMHVNSGYRGRGGAARACASPAIFARVRARSSRPRRRASARCASSIRAARARAGHGSSSCRSSSSHRLGADDVGAAFPHRVAYHPTCHSLRVTRVGDAPLRLLRSVRGLELVELPRAEECCGFGGTFAIKNADTSSAMLADKCDGDRGERRRVLHRARRLVPAADRRRALAERIAPCAPLHLAEILAAT